MADWTEGIELAECLRPSTVVERDNENQPGICEPEPADNEVEVEADWLHNTSDSIAFQPQSNPDGETNEEIAATEAKLAGLLTRILGFVKGQRITAVIWGTLTAVLCSCRRLVNVCRPKDADISTFLAEWTVQKDFIEFSSSLSVGLPMIMVRIVCGSRLIECYRG